MTMKIDNSNSPLLFAPGGDVKTRSPVAKPGDNAPSTATSGTSVNVGSTSVQLHSMGSGLANISVDASKLAEIKQAIKEGRIQINSSAVSESLIKSVIDLISTR